MLDGVEHRRVVWIIVVLHLHVVPVSGKGVLDEVVGSDAEKIHLPDQEFRHLDCGRNFDHDPESDVRRNAMTGIFQFYPGFMQ